MVPEASPDEVVEPSPDVPPSEPEVEAAAAVGDDDAPSCDVVDEPLGVVTVVATVEVALPSVDVVEAVGPVVASSSAGPAEPPVDGAAVAVPAAAASVR